MAKTIIPTNSKEPVRIRFKELSDGSKSLYLDIYQDGKRRKEYLKLYIIPEKTVADKEANRNTMIAANAIKSQWILALTNGKAGIMDERPKGKILLADWLEQYRERQEKRGKYSKHITQLRAALIDYKGEKVAMKDVDKAFCVGFMDYLLYSYRTKGGKPIAQVTAHNYCRNLAIALKAAVREDIISESPFAKIDPADKIQAPKESAREYLTIDEVKKLIATPYSREQVKMAFLFSVFCGLRVSDVESLTWGQIYTENGQCYANVVMKKTEEALKLPLSKEAQKWMPERGQKADSDLVFDDIPRDDYMNKCIKEWVKSAGIKKRVTFHVARHTFATMGLTLGADIYTMSKLLGHKDVTTTQIYAKIVDQKKADAVNLTDGIF